MVTLNQALILNKIIASNPELKPSDVAADASTEIQPDPQLTDRQRALKPVMEQVLTPAAHLKALSKWDGQLLPANTIIVDDTNRTLGAQKIIELPIRNKIDIIATMMTHEQLITEVMFGDFSIETITQVVLPDAIRTLYPDLTVNAQEQVLDAMLQSTLVTHHPAYDFLSKAINTTMLKTTQDHLITDHPHLSDEETEPHASDAIPKQDDDDFASILKKTQEFSKASVAPDKSIK